MLPLIPLGRSLWSLNKNVCRLTSVCVRVLSLCRLLPVDVAGRECLPAFHSGG